MNFVDPSYLSRIFSQCMLKLQFSQPAWSTTSSRWTHVGVERGVVGVALSLPPSRLNVPLCLWTPCQGYGYIYSHGSGYGIMPSEVARQSDVSDEWDNEPAGLAAGISRRTPKKPRDKSINKQIPAKIEIYLTRSSHANGDGGVLPLDGH